MDRSRPARRSRIPPRTVARARRLYEAGEVGHAEIARRLKISLTSVKRLARRGEWRPAGDRVALVGRIRAQVDAELVAVERAMGQEGRPSDAAERSARTLASLVKTLRELARIDDDLSRAGAAEDADEPYDDIADLDELRRTLADRLERLRAERTQ